MTDPVVIAYSLGSSILIALNAILARRVLVRGNLMSGTFATLILSTGLFWTLTAVTSEWRYISWQSLLWFILLGLIVPTVTRPIYFTSILLLGATTTQPLTGVSSLLVVLPSIVFLGESVDIPSMLSILLIVVGAILLEAKAGFDLKSHETNTGNNRALLLLPLLLALLIALSDVARKIGLNLGGTPIMGITVTYTTSTVILALYFVAVRNIRSITASLSGLDHAFIPIALLASASWFMKWEAFRRGEVVFVSPFTRLAALFTLLFGILFLRERERITKKTVTGVLMITAGAVGLSLS